MLIASNISVRFGGRTLFSDVNLKFDGDNCYGLIGANGAGKSTFMKILAGEREATMQYLKVLKATMKNTIK